MMVEVLERDLHTFVWQNAARGRLGQGMEGGIDLSVIKRIIARLRALGNHKDAGLVQCIAAGGIWPNARKYEAKLCESDICPYCNNTTDMSFVFIGVAQTCGPSTLVQSSALLDPIGKVPTL